LAPGSQNPLAELHRLQGELWMVSSVPSFSPARAEAAFMEGLAIARQQEARSWELRLATSLTRLYRRQGKPEEARRVLRDVYGRFTEGHGTADLRAARALLDKPSRPATSDVMVMNDR